MSFREAVANVLKNSGGKYDKNAAAAIVANASRNASPAAKAANPNLKRVKGKAAPKGKAASAKKSSGKKAAPKKKAAKR